MRQRADQTNTAARRRIALVGVAAVLFQAILFGWHHHALPLGRSGPAATLSKASQPLAPATAEDLCDICSILHHQSAAPLAFFTPPTPAALGSAIVPQGPALAAQAAKSGFHARAPPLA